MKLKKLCLVSCFTVITVVILLGSSASAEDAFDATHDFKFMELQRDLRENPKGPRARENLFAIGEYYFQENNLKLATEYFRKFAPIKSNNAEDLIATAYLARCADLAGDTEVTAELKKELEESLSSHSFFSSFNNNHVWSWRSPLGNRFDFREHVDRMEISINDKPFYTINLS